MSHRFANAVLLFWLATHCQGDSVSGNGQWEFWNPEQATPQINWCTAGTAGCVVTTPPGAINYYETGNGNLTSPSNISFVGTAQFMNLSFSFDSATLGPGTDYVGFYVETQAGAIANMIPLFSTASQNSNVLLAVSTGTQYGFYVENVQNQGTAGETDTYYFMNASLNRSNNSSLSPEQHFALYNSLATDTYYIGIQDPADTSQNPVFTAMLLTATYPAPPPQPQVPEPAAAALAAIGLSGTVFFWRRRRQMNRGEPA